MIGQDFPEATTKLGAPEGMEDEVYELPVWHTPGHAAFISQWRMTWRERLHCLLFGYVWLHILSAQHPPVTIETHYPFEGKPPKKAWRVLMLLATLGVVGLFAAFGALMALIIMVGGVA